MPHIVTIDGPSGSGKGTIASLVAEKLGWRTLDSGALYRLVGLAAERAGIAPDDVPALQKLAKNMDAVFRDGHVFLDNIDVTDAIRTEQAGNAASKIATIPEVREALLSWQQGYVREPGLVAEGRDMGTVIFPEARAKIFLTASAGKRAERRYKQLKEKGLDVNMESLVEEISMRDERDARRAVSPLKAAPDALLLDSSNMAVDEVVEKVLGYVKERIPGL
ncbi:MAG TPA: (d)CMP kinase [Chromatiaceae bacterium]|nr:(d)CMP kinase [Chromatiaceae bacterium]